MRLGFIGLGAMGAPMAARLLAAGHEVTVFNRSEEKTRVLVDRGARRADSPAEAARTGVVFTMLTNDAAVEAVSHGETGLLAGLPADGVHVSCSTLSVACAQRLAFAHAAADRHFATATVLGRPPAAASGTLYVMAAAAPEILERITPALDAFSQRIFRVGVAPHHANLMKLICNFLIFSTIEQFAESFAIAEKAGIDRAVLLETLTGSFFSAPVHRNYGALVRDRAYSAKGVDVGLALKDTGMMLDAAQALAAPMPLASLVRDRLLACAAHGERDADFAVLAREAERCAGLV